MNILALVTSGLSNEVVLSWRTLQSLVVLPEDHTRSQFNKANKTEVQTPGQAAQGSQNNEGADGPADGIDLKEGFKALKEKFGMVSNHENEEEVTSWPAIHMRRRIARFEGIPGTQKLADDILVIGRNENELVEQVEHVLEQCKEWEITVNDFEIQFKN